MTDDELEKAYRVGQLSFEGMEIDVIKANLKQCKVSGLGHVSIGDKVRLEIEALCVAVNHTADETLGGVRVQVLEAIEPAKATDTL